MLVLGAACAFCLALQEGEDTYQIRLRVRAENRHNLANILKRHVADLDGIRKMSFDSNTDSLILTVAQDTAITRAQIEETLPKAYSIERYELLGFRGRVSRQKGQVVLRYPGNRQELTLVETPATASWFRDLDRWLAKTDTYAVWGHVDEERTGRGIFQHTKMTVHVTRVENAKIAAPATREPVVLRVLVEDLTHPETSPKALEDGLGRLRGVKGTDWDPEGQFVTVVFDPEQKLNLESIRRAASRHAAVSKIVADGLRGTARREGGTLVLSTPAGDSVRLRAEGPLAKLGLSVALGMVDRGNDQWRVSGELRGDRGEFELILRTIRPGQ